MDLRVARRILAPFRAPPHHLVHKLLPRRLILRERAQQTQQLPLAPRIRLRLALVENFEQEYTQVAAGAALPGLQERLRAPEKDVGGGFPVGGLDVARGDDAELLVGFVELALCDSAGC